VKTEHITYKLRQGVKTRDPLRSLNVQDQQWLRQVLTAYMLLQDYDPRPEFNQWFNKPNEKLLRQPQKNNEYNSPRSFCQGVIEKLSQTPKRRDLSPKTCTGIETLTVLMAEIHGNQIPEIKFIESGTIIETTEFTTLFAKTESKT